MLVYIVCSSSKRCGLVGLLCINFEGLRETLTTLAILYSTYLASDPKDASQPFFMSLKLLRRMCLRTTTLPTRCAQGKESLKEAPPRSPIVQLLKGFRQSKWIAANESWYQSLNLVLSLARGTRQVSLARD